VGCKLARSADALVYGGQDEVFEHGDIPRIHAERVDLDRNNLLSAVGRHRNHTPAGICGDGLVRKLFLDFLDTLLKLLGLFDEFLEVDFHGP